MTERRGPRSCSAGSATRCRRGSTSASSWATAASASSAGCCSPSASTRSRMYAQHARGRRAAARGTGDRRGGARIRLAARRSSSSWRAVNDTTPTAERVDAVRARARRAARGTTMTTVDGGELVAAHAGARTASRTCSGSAAGTSTPRGGPRRGTASASSTSATKPPRRTAPKAGRSRPAIRVSRSSPPDPGLTNALTGIATAHAQRSPMVVIAGAATSRGADSGEVEALDQLEVVRPVTKWARRVHHLDRIPEYVDARVRARRRRALPDPAYLEIAIDLIHSQIDDAEVEGRLLLDRVDAIGAPAPELDRPRRRALLRGAERPAIVAGSGVWWAHAADELRALVEHGIPVVTRQAGRGTHARRSSALLRARLAEHRVPGRRAARRRQAARLLLRLRPLPAPRATSSRSTSSRARSAATGCP